MNIFGVGPAEAGLVFVIALIVVGPQRFPEIMRTAGRWYRMARAYSNEVMKDVRAAVDDIEREVKAETDDLKSVREFADLGADLREAQRDAEEIHRETRAVMRDDKSAPAETQAKAPIRPSQRGDAASDASGGEAVPPIEQSAAETEGADVQTAAPEAPQPVAKPEPARPASTFDPFKKEQPKKGPVLIPRETVSSEGDERL
ncbi:MAG: twin-arginine translocase TatA/TatE family subunit [Dehalococcoidia bacterium]